MEALWDLEDKLKISTLGAVLLLACASFALVCLCIVVTLRRRKAINNKIVHQEGALDEENEKNRTVTNTNTNTNTTTEWSEPSCVGWISVKRVLMGSMVWSKARKLEENIAWQRERGSPLLGLRQGLQSGWQSHNSESPVWQRPILRGEKCELPSFSGLILYDERGRLLRDSQNEIQHFMESSHQEVGTVTVRTTLRDLL